MSGGIDYLLELAASAGIQMRQAGAEMWRGDCVDCGGTDRMVFGVDLNGRPWVKCWGRCARDDILHALGTTWDEVCPPEKPERPTGPLTIKAASVKSRSIRWIWTGRIAVGYITVQTGIEGLGKSAFAAWMIGQLSFGKLPGDWYGEPREVLVVAGEDALEDTWKPRLELVGHDPQRVDFLNLEKLGAKWNIRDGADLLREAVQEVGANVIVFDALLDHLPPSKSGESATQPTFVREALYPLKLAIRELKVGAVMSLHPPKSKAGSFRDLVQLSQAFTAIPRFGLLFAYHPEDDPSQPSCRRAILRGKGNLGRDPGGLEFRIEGRDFTHDDGVTQEREVVVDVRSSSVTVADLFAKDREKTPTKIEQAMKVIRLALSGGQWEPAAPIRERLEAEGLNHNATVQEATTRLGVEKQQRSGELHGGWFWRLRSESSAGDQNQKREKHDSVTLTGSESPRARYIPTLTPTARSGRILSNDGQSLRVAAWEPKGCAPADPEVRVGVSGVPPARATGAVTHITFDCETTGLDPHVDRLTWVGFCADDGPIELLRHPEDRDRIQAAGPRRRVLGAPCHLRPALPGSQPLPATAAGYRAAGEHGRHRRAATRRVRTAPTPEAPNRLRRAARGCA